MEITGKLSEFPLPELLQLLDRRRATGCLALDIFSDYYAELLPNHYDIWLSQGQVVSLKRKSCKCDIYDLAVRNEWISLFVARKLKERSPQNTAAGLYLESQGALDFGQLRSLFFSEVVHRVEALCDIQTANFKFQSNTNLQMSEMTGLSIPAAKVAKHGMRNQSQQSFAKKTFLKSMMSHPCNPNESFQTTSSLVFSRRIP